MCSVPFSLDNASQSPKYLQIVNGITRTIEAGDLKVGDPLPSLSELCGHFSVARDTVVRAYGELKSRGVIKATPRRGYYVATESVSHLTRLFLLFDELSPYKELLYKAMMEELAGRVAVDTFFHHYNLDVFRSLLRGNRDSYSLFVVMPFPRPEMPEILGLLDPEKLFILDRRGLVADGFPHVCQDFDHAVSSCLEHGAELLAKYRRLVLVFPEPSNHPPQIKRGFRRFCRKQGMAHRVVSAVRPGDVETETAYFVIDDRELVAIVEHCQSNGLQLGKDVGVLSYNDTPMKRVVAQGITVISTDFEDLGRRTARYILERRSVQETTPTRLIVRQSL